VLDLLGSGAAVGDLLHVLGVEYEIDRATLERDVRAYVQELLDAGIIEDVAA
jgi:hypothetical protein